MDPVRPPGRAAAPGRGDARAQRWTTEFDALSTGGVVPHDGDVTLSRADLYDELVDTAAWTGAGQYR